MDRRDFLKTLAAASAMLTVKSNGVMDIMASTLPGTATAQAAADNYADMAAIMNGEPAAMLRAALEQLGGIKRFVKKGDKVTLKPNIGWDRTPELAANTNRFTPASREATSIFKKPPTFTSFDVIGSFTERGTEPNAASCNTYSIPSTAFLQSPRLRISPTTNLNVSGYCSIRGNRFSICPVAKLSKHTT